MGRGEEKRRRRERKESRGEIRDKRVETRELHTHKLMSKKSVINRTIYI